MLPKARRISKSDFPNLMKTGWGLSSANFNLKYSALASGSQGSRWSVVVSKKIAKTALDRNKLKRRARYVLTKNLAKMKPGYQVAIFFRANLLKAPFSALEAELINLLNRAKLLHA